MSTIRELAEAVQAWHSNATGQLQQILDAPADTEIRLGTDPDSPVLTGEKAQGFRAGIMVALSFVAKLPFKIDEPDPIHVKVVEVLIEHLGIDGDEPADSDLRGDFGADDLDISEILLNLNDTFEISLDLPFSEVKTVKGLADLVRKAIAEKACKPADELPASLANVPGLEVIDTTTGLPKG